MRIEQEKIPSAEDILKSKLDPKIAILNNPDYTFNKVIEAMEELLYLHKKAIKYEYDQYQDTLCGWRDGSASISETNAAHDRFIELLKL